MKRYLLLITKQRNWDKFKAIYKDSGLGNNLNDAIEELIRRQVEDAKK